MKIAFVSDWFLPRLGGIELQMRDLAVRLLQRGHEVEVITPVAGPDLVDGVRVHRLNAPTLPGAGIVFTAGAFSRMRELLNGGRYDVAHVHFGIVAPAAWGGARIAQSLGIPTVATFHSVLRHFEAPLWLMRGAMGVADWRVHWSAVSSVVSQSIRPLVGDGLVEILPNAIDPGWWANASHTADAALVRDDASLTAVAVMRLHPRKRPRALLRAVAALRHHPSGRRLRLRIIGDGGEAPVLRRMIRREALEDTVTLCGWMPPEAIRDELHRADVFVLPSRLEAFGIAALEARCAGLPVIAMAQGGARDFLTHGEDALLARSDADLTEYLRRLLEDPALRRRLARGAAAPPRGVSWECAVERQLLAYGRAIASGLPSSGHERIPAHEERPA